MPRIINALSNTDDSLSTALSGLATSLFGDEAKRELIRQSALSKIRENENIPLAAEALSSGNVQEAVRRGVMGGMKGGDAGDYNLLGASGRATDVNDPALTIAAVGAGKPYSGTPGGVNQSEANRVAIENLRTQRQYDAEKLKNDTTPVNVVVNGRPQIASRSTAIGQQPLIGENEVKGTVAGNMLLPGAPPAFPPGNSSNFGGTPISIDYGDGQVDTPQQPTQAQRLSDAFSAMSPTAQKYLGASGPTTPYIYRSPSTGESGTTLDTKSNALTGKPLPPDAIVGSLQAQNSDAFTSNHQVMGDLLKSRVSTEQAKARIDGLVNLLNQPNADQSVGWLGKGAGFLNDVRAQVEAASRLSNGTSYEEEIHNSGAMQAVDGVMKNLFSDQATVARMRQLGIDHAVIRSNITDLAYMYAKAMDPSGRVSNQDIQNAARTVGATLMDPKAGVQVLNDLRNRLDEGQRIREEQTKRMFPQGTVPGQQPAAAQPAPAAQPGATPVTPEVWRRGPDGQPMRVQ